MKRNSSVVIVGILLFLSTQGCDKIPFISKYFPSLKNDATQTAESQPAALVSTAVSTPPITGDILARVGSWTLTLDEFNRKLASLREAIPEYNVDDPESKKLVLEELIRQELLVEDAERSGIAKQKDILDAIEEFRRTLLVRETAFKITENITTTDTEAQDYYTQNKDAFRNPLQWHLREILVFTEEEAKGILIELLQGADFAATAQARSKSASAVQGGDLGFVSELKFPQMEMALSTLEVGSASNIVKGPDGFYIFKLEEKKGGDLINFDEAKEDIKSGLTLMKQQQKILDYIKALEQKTTVEKNEALLGK